MGNTATNQAFHSGKRLQKLRELEGVDILELAEKYNISFTLLEQVITRNQLFLYRALTN